MLHMICVFVVKQDTLDYGKESEDGTGRACIHCSSFDSGCVIILHPLVRRLTLDT